MVSVDEATLRASLPSKKRARTAGAEPQDEASEVRHLLRQLDVLEDYCLALLLRFDYLAEDAGDIRTEHFLSAETRELFEVWREVGTQELTAHLDELLLERLERIQEVALPPMTESMARTALAQCIHRLEERRLRELKTQQRLQLAEEEAEQGAKELAVAAYEQWKQNDLIHPELLVNRDLQQLMRRKRPESRAEVES